MRGNYIVNEESVMQFDKAIRLMDESIKELRAVAHNMMPEALIKFGLKDALEDYCNRFSENKNLKVLFAFFGSERRFDKNFEINVYRIVQELVNNALKHAAPSEIIVQLVIDENRVHFTVQDNGKGFDTEILKTSKSSGIANVYSRSGIYYGRVDIVSKPGKGTEIAIEFEI
jgi:signal transduction histidine kinase